MLSVFAHLLGLYAPTSKPYTEAHLFVQGLWGSEGQ